MNASYVGFGAAELLFLFVWIYSLITLLKYPTWAWSEAGHSRSMWLLLVILALFLPCVGYVILLWFLFSTSGEVRRVAKLGHRPGFPGR